MAWHYTRWGGPRRSVQGVNDFGDFGVSFVATVAGRYTRRGGARLSVQGEPLLVPTRDFFFEALFFIVAP